MRRFATALALFVWATASLADSDGAFCIGPEYLAFELSFSYEPESHRLYLMRFENPAGWKEISSIEMPYFSFPNMKCETNVIRLATWDAVYSVSLSESNAAELSLQTEPRPPGPPSLQEYPDDLGSLSRGISRPYAQHDFALPSNDPVYSYELHVSKLPDPNDRCIYHVRSWVTQVVAGDVVDEHELLALDQTGECGE